MADSTNKKLIIESKLGDKKLRDLWGRRMESGKKFITDQYNKETAKYIRLLRHELKGMLPGDFFNTDAGVDVNVIFPIVKQLIPNLYFQDPKVFVSSLEDKIVVKLKDENGEPIIDPATREQITDEFDATRAAVKFKNVLNDNLKEISFKQTIKDVILDAHIGFFGAVKLGWDNEQGVNTMKGNAPPSSRTDVVEDNAFAVRLKPWNVIADMADFYNPQWIAVRYTVQPVILQQDTRLKHTEKIVGNAELGETERKRFWQFLNKEDTILTEYYEIYIRPSANYPEGQYLILSPEVKDDFLFRSNKPYDFNDSTIKLLYFNPDPEGGLPAPDVRYYYGQQKAKSNLRRTEYEYIQRTMPGIAINTSGAKDATKLIKQIESGRIPRVIETTLDANRVVASVTYPTLNPQFNQFNNTIDNDVAKVSGLFKGVIASGGGQNVKFAEVAKISTEGEQIILTEKGDVVRDFITNIIRTMSKLHKEFGPDERNVFLDDEKSPSKMVRQELQGKIKIEIQPFSMKFEDPTIIRRQLTDLLNLGASPAIGDALQKVGKSVDIAKAFEMIVNTFPNREFESLIVKEEFTPVGQIVLAMKENQALANGEQVPLNDSDIDEIHIIIHGLQGDATLEHMQLHQQKIQARTTGKPGGGNAEGLPVKGVAVSQEQIKEPLSPSSEKQGAAIVRETDTR